MDKEEEFSIQLQELEKLNSFFERPLNNNIANKGGPEQLIEYLVEDSMNSRRNGIRTVKIARFLNSAHDRSLNKIKELKKKNSMLISKLEETVSHLESAEKNLYVSEERTDYLTREIEDIEKALSETTKDKEKLKKELSAVKKSLAQMQSAELNSSETEKKSLLSFKEESTRKLSDVQMECNKKASTIEDLVMTIKSLENKILAEKNASDALRSQVNSLKNDIFSQNSKISELKTKNYGLKEKINEKDQEITVIKQENEMLLQELELYKATERIKPESFAEIETEDQTLESGNKNRPVRSEILSDFFVTEENEEDDEAQKNSGENLMYFITNPGYSYPKIYNLDVNSGESIQILSPKFRNSVPMFMNSESKISENRRTLNITPDKIVEYEVDKKEDVLQFKDPVKHYFISICQDFKNKSQFRAQFAKIPTNKLYDSLIKQKIPLCKWPELISEFFISKIRV